MKPEIRAISCKKIRYFKDLLARKRQLTEARTQELNRLDKSKNRMDATHRRAIKFIDKEIEWVNTKLNKEIAEITEWQQTYELLKSAPGIGDGERHDP